MLTLQEFADAKGFDVEALSSFGWRNGPTGIEIPYYQADGTEHPRTKRRHSLAHVPNWSSWTASDESLPVYGMNHPVPIDKFVFVVEGESDSVTLWLNELPALGIPGATNDKTLTLEHVGSAQEIYVIQEPDEIAGARFPTRIATRLYNLGYAGKVYALSLAPAKDPHELWVSNKEAFRDSLRAAMRGRKEIVPPTKPTGSAQGHVLTSEQFLALDENLPYTWEGLIPVGGTVLLGASPKVGKTVLANKLALAIARGEPLLGREVAQGPVLYLSLDEARHLTRKRYNQIGLRPDDQITFFFGVPPHDWATWLRNLVVTHHPKFLVVDTIAKLLRPKTMSDYAEWVSGLAPLMQLRDDFGLSQVWLNHTRKAAQDRPNAFITAEDILGSQAIRGSVDTTIMLHANEDRLRFLYTEQRYGDDVPRTPLLLDPETLDLTLGSKAQYVQT